ncbi:MAG: hypothetical protein RR012_03090 [Oscillospiraceae bacterium]
MGKIKKVFVSILFVAYIIAALYSYEWNKYYKNVWEPLIECSQKGFSSSGNSYERDINGYKLYLYAPSTFEFSGNLQINTFTQYDPSSKGEERSIGILIFPLRDGSFEWMAFIDENYQSDSCTTYFDPKTMKILSNISDVEKEIFEQNKLTINILVQEACSFWNINI